MQGGMDKGHWSYPRKGGAGAVEAALSVVEGQEADELAL